MNQPIPNQHLGHTHLSPAPLQLIPASHHAPFQRIPPSSHTSSLYSATTRSLHAFSPFCLYRSLGERLECQEQITGVRLYALLLLDVKQSSTQENQAKKIRCLSWMLKFKEAMQRRNLATHELTSSWPKLPILPGPVREAIASQFTCKRRNNEQAGVVSAPHVDKIALMFVGLCIIIFICVRCVQRVSTFQYTRG